METFSALLAICAGNSPVPGEFPAQRPETRCIDVFFDLRLNKPLSKQWWGCWFWFEMLSRPLWRHYNGIVFDNVIAVVHLNISEGFNKYNHESLDFEVDFDCFVGIKLFGTRPWSHIQYPYICWYVIAQNHDVMPWKYSSHFSRNIVDHYYRRPVNCTIYLGTLKGKR